MMDLAALRANWKTARTYGRRFVDRIKYLLWIYDVIGNIVLRQRQRLTIRLKFPDPVGQVVLTVRCNNGSDAFIFSEVFHRCYYAFELPMTPRTILDVGANIGFATLFFARQYPSAQIASVEPIPENAQLLRANLRNNRVRARVIEKAISIADGPICMQLAANDYGHKVANIKFGRKVIGESQQVSGVTIPALMSEFGWERIDLLKLDIEGYEGVLLLQNSAWLALVNAICIEVHEGFGETDLAGIARTYGFHTPHRLPGTWLLVRE